MSSNIATEVRRISDARSRLKSIIDQQARAQAALLSPDNFKFQTNATLAQSDLGLTDNVAVLDAQAGATVSALVPPQAPIEPDLATLTMWMPLANLGSQDDLALMGNTSRTRGGCSLIAGPAGGGNGLIGGTRAVFVDGSTSYLDVADDPDIRMPTASGGFSFCVRINVTSYSLQLDRVGGDRRTIACKTDDANNSWEITLDETNGDILFHVMRAATEYKVKFTGTTLNTWLDIVCTYAISGNALTIYKNNVASTTASTKASQYPLSGDTDLHIGHSDDTIFLDNGGINEYGLGPGVFDPLCFDSLDFDCGSYLDPPTNTIPHSTIDGGFAGAMYDPRFYNVVLTSAQVGNLYTNKFSISSIPAGASGNAGYCLAHS